MGELERLREERKKVAIQVEIFNRRGQDNTIWHKTMKRIEARIEELEALEQEEFERDISIEEGDDNG